MCDSTVADRKPVRHHLAIINLQSLDLMLHRDQARSRDGIAIAWHGARKIENRCTKSSNNPILGCLCILTDPEKRLSHEGDERTYSQKGEDSTDPVNET